MAAYEKNAVLQAQRQGVPIATANYDKARSGFLPRITGSADSSYIRSDTRFPGSAAGPPSQLRPRSVAIEMSYTLFDGGRTLQAARQAGHGMAGAREDVRNAEQGTLLEAAAAYIDVMRDRLILDFERQNLASLQEQLKLIDGLFQYGDVTDVDRLQVKSRVSEAQARVGAAEGTLKASAATYAQVIGHAPRDLKWPRLPEKFLAGLEKSHWQDAVDEHPAVLSAKAAAAAADARLASARGEHAPTVTIAGTLGRYISRETSGVRANDATLLGRVSVPIYTGGAISAGVREAHGIVAQKNLEHDAARIRIEADILRAKAQHAASLTRVTAVKQQLDGAARALKGLREEFGLGQRTAIAVLDGSQDLLNANIALANAQRDRIASGFNLLRAFGRLSIDTLPFVQNDNIGQTMQRHASQKLLPVRQQALRLKPIDDAPIIGLRTRGDSGANDRQLRLSSKD